MQHRASQPQQCQCWHLSRNPAIMCYNFFLFLCNHQILRWGWMKEELFMNCLINVIARQCFSLVSWSSFFSLSTRIRRGGGQIGMVSVRGFVVVVNAATYHSDRVDRIQDGQQQDVVLGKIPAGIICNSVSCERVLSMLTSNVMWINKFPSFWEFVSCI